MSSSLVEKNAGTGVDRGRARFHADHRRWWGVHLIWLVAACGVTEHPHENSLVPVDPNNDFAPANPVTPPSGGGGGGGGGASKPSGGGQKKSSGGGGGGDSLSGGGEG